MAQKNITLGLVAHVDSGKTTLTEAMLVGAGALRQAGRVEVVAPGLEGPAADAHVDAFHESHSSLKPRRRARHGAARRGARCRPEWRHRRGSMSMPCASLPTA